MTTGGEGLGVELPGDTGAMRWISGIVKSSLSAPAPAPLDPAPVIIIPLARREEDLLAASSPAIPWVDSRGRSIPLDDPPSPPPSEVRRAPLLPPARVCSSVWPKALELGW